MKGFGLKALTKLACFISQIQHSRMEMNLNYSSEDWRQDLLRNIVFAAKEDKPVVYMCDEFRISDPNWYHDLETVLKSSICSEITRKAEIMECLVTIKAQLKRGYKALKTLRKSPGQAQTSKGLKDFTVDHKAFLDQVKAIESNPFEMADLYYSFLKRVKKNFHLIVHFSPSSETLKHKLQKYRQLLICSQMVWVQNLQQADLEAIGQTVFVDKAHRVLEE